MDGPIRVATSPDGLLTLELYGEEDHILGFKGSDWHTHGDLLVPEYGSTPQLAVLAFFDSILNDQQVICVSSDEVQVWITDDMEQELASANGDPPVVRLWSGNHVGTAVGN